MSRQKKSRRVTDVMPIRKADNKIEITKGVSKKSRKPTRYELDLLAKEEKRKRKRKGLATGSRHNDNAEKQKSLTEKLKKDPRVGSRKKVPLMVEFVNQPAKGKIIPAVEIKPQQIIKLSPDQELTQLENNECLNDLLDQLEAGKTLSAKDQLFVDECLVRIEQLMTELGLVEEEQNDDELLRQFETIDINKFR